MKKLILTLSPLVLPFVAFAQDGILNERGVVNIPNPEDTIASGGAEGIIGLLATVADWLFTVLLVLAVIMILMAAFKYLFAGGDDDKIKTAHKMLIYAAVAIAVGLLSQAVIFIVESIIAPNSY